MGGLAAWFAIAAAVAAPEILWVVLRIGGAAVALTGATVAVADTVVVIIVSTVGGVALLAMAAVVIKVAVMLMVRLTKLLTVVQAAISIADGMEMVINATAWLWSMVTVFALG